MRLIKRYSDRRLYDLRSSKFVNHRNLLNFLIEGEDVRILCSRTGDDLSSEIMMRILMEIDGGLDMFSLSFLQRLVRVQGTGKKSVYLRERIDARLKLMDAELDELEKGLDVFSSDSEG